MEVTNNISFNNIFHDKELKESNEDDNLQETTLRDGINGSPFVEDGGEDGSRVFNLSGKSDSVTGHNLSKEFKLGNMAVLDINVTKTVKLVLVGISQKTNGIK